LSSVADGSAAIDADAVLFGVAREEDLAPAERAVTFHGEPFLMEFRAGLTSAGLGVAFD